MLCASYADPRLAAVYGALNPPGDDLPCDLAARGHRVTGSDPAAAMLDIARNRPGGDKVSWIATDAAGLSVDTRFDLVVGDRDRSTVSATSPEIIVIAS